MKSKFGWPVVGVMIIASVGCGTKSDPYPASTGYGGAYGNSTSIEFKDDVKANATPKEEDLTALTFTGQDGTQVPLTQYLGEKNLVLVITRGYAGAICPYCATQTSRLIANYAKIREKNAEVIVVYPLDKPADQPNVDKFVAQAVSSLPAADRKVPFPLLLDVELQAVDALGIRKSLSKPATYIFSKDGQVRFAYVGESLADRPSIKVILSELDRLNEMPNEAGGG